MKYELIGEFVIYGHKRNMVIERMPSGFFLYSFEGKRLYTRNHQTSRRYRNLVIGKMNGTIKLDPLFEERLD